jgi:CxxC-x17-CxxC domain-containing protein
MGNFNRGGGGFGGKKRFDNDRGFRGGDRSDRPQMHKAICADCGKSCEVPFRPTGDKPVYCSDCFGGNEKRGNDRSGGGNEAGSSQYKNQFEMLNIKLDNILRILSPKTAGEKPTVKAIEKPVVKAIEKPVVKAIEKKVEKKVEKKAEVKKVVVKKPATAPKKDVKKVVAKKKK